MKTYYTIDSILFPDEKIIMDNNGNVAGYTIPGILGDTLIFDDKGKNIGWTTDSILFPGEKNIFLEDKKDELF